MKYFLFVFVIAIFLSSCKSQINAPDNAITGTIQKIEASTFMYGTHTLSDSNGKTLYALYSSKINLDMYNHKKVALIGVDKGGGVDGGPPYLEVTNVWPIE